MKKLEKCPTCKSDKTKKWKDTPGGSDRLFCRRCGTLHFTNEWGERVRLENKRKQLEERLFEGENGKLSKAGKIEAKWFRDSVKKWNRFVDAFVRLNKVVQ